MSYNVTLQGQTFPDFNLTFAISGTISDTDAVCGLAVCQDTTAANTVKLATDGSEILGQILVVEDRTNQAEGVVASVACIGGMKFKLKADESVSVGDHVVGAGNGEVRKAVAGTDTSVGLPVFEVQTGYVVCLKLS